MAALALPPPWDWLSETLWGVVVIYLWTRPSLRSIAAMVLMAGALLLVYAALEPRVWDGLDYAPIRRAGFFFGWSSLLQLCWYGPSHAYMGAAALPMLVVLRLVGLSFLDLGNGPTIDPQMLILDHYLGDPAYVVGRWLIPYPALRDALWTGYMGVALTLPMAYGAAVNSWTRRRLLWSWIVAGAFSGPLYKIFPVAGPAYAFQGWPSLPTGVTWATLYDVPAGLERTGMPSLHLTWAILAWYLAPRSPGWVRWFNAFFVAITVAATLGLGQHYLVDLIAAVPYTAAVVWVVTRFIPSDPVAGNQPAGQTEAVGPRVHEQDGAYN